MMFGFSDVYLKDALFETPLFRTPRPDGGLRLINTAMMHNHSKGHGVLLQAVADLHKRDIAVELTLIGDGALRHEFETQAAQLGLGDHVTFVGIVNADLVAADHVAEHDLFVLPSFQEGMPRAMLEAMAAGTPVIASNVGGIPEVLGEESMVAPGDVPRWFQASKCWLGTGHSCRHERRPREKRRSPLVSTRYKPVIEPTATRC